MIENTETVSLLLVVTLLCSMLFCVNVCLHITYLHIWLQVNMVPM